MTAGHPVQALDVRVRLVGGRQVVGRGSQVCELNDVATFIWRLCDGTSSTEAIAKRVAEEYDIDDRTALEDTVALLAELEELGLIESS